MPKKSKRNRRTKTLDLHGLTYPEAKDAVDLFVLTEESPFKIITGNSSEMKALTANILDKHELYYYFESWYNLGCLVIVENKINDK
ncbi:hypothetical protein CMI47_01760 [Candidatus Pacearchaeota archaeon]|nr:hypothetical protein [Candidatus Pacearchaeota archaeon]